MRNVLLRRSGWLGLGFLLIAVGTLAVLRPGPDGDVAAGDCLRVVQDEIEPSAPPGTGPFERVGCDEADAAYVVGVRMETPVGECPADIYTVHRDSDSTLCLMYNVDEGECFLESPLETGPFDCADGPKAGAIKILKRVEGATDLTVCDAVNEPGVAMAVIPKPATTFCYVDFGNGERPPVAT